MLVFLQQQTSVMRLCSASYDCKETAAAKLATQFRPIGDYKFGNLTLRLIQQQGRFIDANYN